MRINVYRLILEQIGPSDDEWLVLDTLRPIGKAIRSCHERIEHLPPGANQEYIEAVVETEVQLVENLLGAAFVVCQVPINKAIASIEFLHKRHERDAGKAAIGIERGRRVVMALDPIRPGRQPYTRVEIINAAANYFKHGAEWLCHWEDLKKPQEKYTADVMTAAGASRGSSGNLRTIAELLGNGSFDNVLILADTITEWRMKVRETCEAALSQSGLI